MTLIGTCRLSIRDDLSQPEGAFFESGESFRSATLRVIHRPRVSHPDICSSVLLIGIFTEYKVAGRWKNEREKGLLALTVKVPQDQTRTPS